MRKPLPAPAARGRRGGLRPEARGEELIHAIRAVAAGGTYLDPAIAGKVVGGFVRPREPAAGGELSEREAEVVRLTAAGHSNKEIAARLDLSVKTVETYKARSLEKLGLHSRADLVRYALQRGWLQRRLTPKGPPLAGGFLTCLVFSLSRKSDPPCDPSPLLPLPRRAPSAMMNGRSRPRGVLLNRRAEAPFVRPRQAFVISWRERNTRTYHTIGRRFEGGRAMAGSATSFAASPTCDPS